MHRLRRAQHLHHLHILIHPMNGSTSDGLPIDGCKGTPASREHRIGIGTVLRDSGLPISNATD